MKKRMLRSMLLSCMLVIMLLPTVALAEGEHSHSLCRANSCTADHNGDDQANDHSDVIFDSVADETALIAAAASGGSVYLTNDIVLTSTITVARDKTLYLCLNGHKISPALDGGNLAFTDSAIAVNSGATFVLTDCGTDGAITGFTDDYGGGVYVGGGGTFTMTGGTISNNNATRDGGGVHVSGGTFIMNGGTISGNKAGGEGGGVYFYVDGSYTFTMNGGTITNNEATTNGGGVCVDKGTFTMNDGDITGNKAKNGGGVYVSGKPFTMTGGTISNNSVSGNLYNGGGGGVYVNGKPFTMSGGTISNNSVLGSDDTSGGGVFVESEKFTMSGGVITGNTAPNGSAVNTLNFNMSSGSITNNTVTGSDANDCAVCAYGTIELSGNCTIFGNKTSDAVEKNLRLPDGNTITIAGELNNAKIGVTTVKKPIPGSSVQITYNSGSSSYSNCFFSDNPAYLVVPEGGVLKLKVAPTYAITTTDAEYGSVTVDKSTATAGTTVTITATPDEGYEVDTVKYYETANEANITEVAMSNNTGTFTMPAYNVTVSVTFKKIYSITPEEALHGTVTVSKSTAAAGETVTITATPDDGYEVDTITVTKDGDGSAVEVTNNTFTMPAEAVTVSVTFKEISGGNSSSSSPGSSSARPSSRPSGSSSGITSKTEKNEDGSSTTTTTNRITGTVTETTKNTDGTTGTTVTDKSGNITAVSATVPAAAVSAAEKTGKPVTVPVEVPVAKHSEDALPIKVEIPTGGVTVEIPVENVTPGTVVVIVAKDGTEQVVRTSSVSETGVVVNLAQDATVKVVDMSHNFVDVHPVNHWAADAIDFVAARGIFNGTSADVFTPDGSMTRQALWMTLARMSGEEPADMAAARDWAMENEVSDGSNPLSTVTRQQYVTMLWRWAAAEGMDISAGEETNLLSFTDANKISDYAVEAFRWACGEGIVDGYNDDTLRAMTNASRAHAAAMMMRFCAGVVN